MFDDSDGHDVHLFWRAYHRLKAALDHLRSLPSPGRGVACRVAAQALLGKPLVTDLPLASATLVVEAQQALHDAEEAFVVPLPVPEGRVTGSQRDAATDRRHLAELIDAYVAEVGNGA